MSVGTAFTTIRTEGAILPPDILNRIAAGDNDLGGLTEASYHLTGEKFGEATNRAWNRLQSAWLNLQTAREKLPTSDAGTTVARERWLLPLFQLLDYGRLQIAKAQEIGGKTYAISHAWQHVPIHLVGCNVDLDSHHRGTSPHSLLQEFLNRSEGHLWGIISNGLRLRLLRDNISLTRQAYVEFDLEAMMAGEAYPDFVLLWLVLHQSRFEGERPELAWIEKWSQAARTEGVRVLDGLRDGVQRAIESLGQGALAHPANTTLREALRGGSLDKQDYYRELLRLVYRLIFLFVAEDRKLLLDPAASAEARERYTKHYAVARIRRLAISKAGSRHDDLYRVLKLVMERLSLDGCPDLALNALGSFLFSTRSMTHLDTCEIANRDLLVAVRSLAVMQTKHGMREVDYRNLGAEELGSVYESLLELHPAVDATAAVFELKVAAGSERKKTGSYYTPTSLIACLLDSALDPVVAEAARQPDPEQAILKLKVIDPACGSGHFLIAAGHRIAKRLAAVRTGEEEPPPEAQRNALRDVIGHCLYGVDVNPMAVELCKVSLWMEALEPGKPLSFLEHRIQCGNSLLGAMPALLAKGIPDEAFTPIEGDDKEICREFKRINKDERNKQMRLFAATTEPWHQLGNFAASLMNLDAVGDDSIAAIREKERLYEEAIRSGDYLDGRFWADTWCASFVWKKTREFNYPVTEEIFRRIERNPHGCEPWMRNEIQRLAGQFHFLHWHLAFPDVFRIPPDRVKPENGQTGWNGGFDIVLGNPPWERVKIQEKEWFVERNPEIANAPHATSRKQLIEALTSSDPSLYQQFLDDLRKAEGESHLLRNSGRYPLCGRGDINLYAVFAEGMRCLLSMAGRVGCILPTGIATDDTTKFFFQDVVQMKSLASLFDFENKGLFPGVHSSYKFCLFTSGRGVRPTADAAEFVFFAHAVEDLRDEQRRYSLSADDIARLNPDTRTCPVFRSARDAELTKTIYRSTTVVGASTSSGGWGVDYLLKLVDPTIHRDLLITGAVALQFRKAESPEAQALPLYEGKQIYHFDHRYATFDGHEEARSTRLAEKLEAGFSVMPRYWLTATDFKTRLQGRSVNYHAFLSVRDITNVTNERTVVTAIRPFVPALNSLGNLFCSSGADALFLCGCLNSYAADYIARQKVGGSHLSPFYLMQLAVIPPSYADRQAPWSEAITARQWVEQRVLELSYTSWDLEPFAQEANYDHPPLRWSEERRFLLRCELDAAFFRLYLAADSNGNWRRSDGETAEASARLKSGFPTPRDAVTFMMDTFPIVRRKDEQQFGEYRTKRVILEIYDAMAQAERTTVPYQSRSDPPPADPRCCHPRKKVGILAFGSLIKDPGPELAAKIVMRIKTQTPFPVEYGRFSGRTRGGSPTLVPHCTGTPVRAEILVLDDEVSASDAQNMLWRRERRKIGSGETYVEGTEPDSVLVNSHESPWVETVLYTDFNASGKIADPTPEDLACHAIQSVLTADRGKDGISYLMGAVACGIETRLTAAYTAEILKQTQTNSLSEALRQARDRSE